MDKIKNGMEANSIEDVYMDLCTLDSALRDVGRAANRVHNTELQEWAKETRKLVRTFMHEQNARLEEYEERT